MFPKNYKLMKPVDQVAVEWTRNRTSGVLQKSEPFMKSIIVSASSPHDDVSMTIHVFSQAVVGNISSKFQRALEVGRFKCVVHHKKDAWVRLHDISYSTNINNLQSWVGWSFNPNHLGIGTNSSGYTLWNCCVNE